MNNKTQVFNEQQEIMELKRKVSALENIVKGLVEDNWFKTYGTRGAVAYDSLPKPQEEIKLPYWLG